MSIKEKSKRKPRKPHPSTKIIRVPESVYSHLKIKGRCGESLGEVLMRLLSIKCK